jgi:myo-inositol-1(or 4)-monophosphatase
VLAKDASVEQEAFRAADTWGREALRIAREIAGQPRIAIETKRDDFDLTTPADKQIERYLADAIRQRFPDHAILGEEGSEVPGAEPWQWIIDPIDGTYNFATGLPGSACSVALQFEGETRVGFLADLASGAVLRARRAHGLVSSQPGWVFDRRARDHRGSARLFLETGTEAFDVDMLGALSQLASVRRIVPRLVGSAAIALLSAALKGGTFVGIGLRLWDVAAGVLLAEEAGLLARWWHGPAHVVHLVVGEKEEVDGFGPVVAELARRWDPLTARLVPISSG